MSSHYPENTNSLIIQVSSLFSTTQNNALNCTECWDDPRLRWSFGYKNRTTLLKRKLDHAMQGPSKSHKTQVRRGKKCSLQSWLLFWPNSLLLYCDWNNTSIKLHCLVKIYTNLLSTMSVLDCKTINTANVKNWLGVFFILTFNKAYPLISRK